MADDMQTRVAKLEWRQEALELNQRRQDERISELRGEIGANHRELMQSLGELRDDNSRSKGRHEAQLHESQKSRDRLKWVSIVLGFVGTLVALGWIGEAKGENSTRGSKGLVDVALVYRDYDRRGSADIARVADAIT